MDSLRQALTGPMLILLLGQDAQYTRPEVAAQLPQCPVMAVTADEHLPAAQRQLPVMTFIGR
jgi:hypothetical protein